jgi:hypothetical protein
MDSLLRSINFAGALMKRFARQGGRGGIEARYALSFAVKRLRNFATFGATTAVQYPWN